MAKESHTIKAKESTAYFRELRALLGSSRINKSAGIKPAALARYCKDPDIDYGNEATTDLFQRVMILTGLAREDGRPALEFEILSMLAASGGYKLVSLTPEEPKRKASATEACLETTRTLVEMHTAMCGMAAVGKVSALADAAHKAIDFAVSVWTKAKAKKDMAVQDAMNLVLERSKELE